MGNCIPTCGKSKEMYKQHMKTDELAKYYNEKLLDIDDLQNKLLRFRVAISNIKGKSLTKVFI